MKSSLNYLCQLGLKEIEAKLYLGLLSEGETTVMKLAQKVNIKRVTAHFHVENLIQKGLVVEKVIGAKRFLIPNPPQAIKDMLENKKIEIDTLDQEFPKFIKSIQQQMNGDQLPQQFLPMYHGVDGFREASNRSLDYAEDEIFFLFNMDDWCKTYTVELDRKYYIPTRIKRSIQLRVLTFESPLMNEYKTLDEKESREIRFLASPQPMHLSLMIYNNEVAFLQSKYPYSAMVIHDPDYYQAFRMMFKNLWEMNSLSFYDSMKPQVESLI